MQPSVTDKPGAADVGENETAVEFGAASAAYNGSAEKSLNSLSVKIPRGSTVGIIGGTGSGKTTLVNLIPRFYDVSEGFVMVNGTDVRNLKIDELRQAVGVVPQKAALVSGTVRENMQWGKPNATDEEIKEALHIAQADFALEKAGGLDFRIAQGGKNLSGGQRQRLTIARAYKKTADFNFGRQRVGARLCNGRRPAQSN